MTWAKEPSWLTFHWSRAPWEEMWRAAGGTLMTTRWIINTGGPVRPMIKIKKNNHNKEIPVSQRVCLQLQNKHCVSWPRWSSRQWENKEEDCDGYFLLLQWLSGWSSRCFVRFFVSITYSGLQLTFRCLAEQTAGFPGSVSASLPSVEPSMLTGSQELPVVQETMGAWCTFWMQDR